MDQTKENTYYGVIRQRISNLTKSEHSALIQLCRIAKNLYNETLYNIRRYFFLNKNYLRFETDYHLVKNSRNYKLLNSNVAQQIMKRVHISFESYLALLKLEKQKKLLLKKPSIPKYLAEDELYPLYIAKISVKDGKLTIPLSREGKEYFPKIIIKVPKIIKNLDVKEIRVVPIADGKWFEIHYVYKVNIPEKIITNTKKALGIKLGIDNLVTCIDTEGNGFIIDSKPFKNRLQELSNEITKLKLIYTKQGITKITKRMVILKEKRKNIVKDYMHKAAKIIIDYCLKNDISYIVIGYNSSFINNSSNRKNNKETIFIPFGYFINLIKHKCKKYGIYCIKVDDDNYTSYASALDKDPLPNDLEYTDIKFSGKLIEKDLYLTKDGIIIDANVNSSLNILRKAGFELNFTHIPKPELIQIWK